LYNADFRDVLDDIQEDIIIITDPPYNIGFKYNKYQDNLPHSEYYQMLTQLIQKYPTVLILYNEILHELTKHSGITPTKIMQWIYPSNTMKQHRCIAYYNVTPDLSKVRQPYKNPKDKRIKQRIRQGSKGARSYDWWEIPQVKNVSKEKGIHPCPTPLQLMDNIIKVIPENFTVCDPFMGGGGHGVYKFF
jgi:site-specific DNA-adenine methylase